MMKGFLVLSLIVGSFALSEHQSSAQGNLTPPGAPAPTMKSLGQIEPRQPISSIGYNITTPGSYYVTTNLTGTTNGIVIASDNVTLDLGGFTLTGSGGLYTGIVLIGTHTNIVIRDGNITKFGVGIDATSANDSRFERLKVYKCSNGFNAGTNAMLADCSVTGCSYGINTGPKAVLRHCYANNNTGTSVAGIWVGENSVIESCRATANTGTYVSGIIALDGTTVTDCSASSNTWNGIYLGVGAVAKNCSASYNSQGLYGSQGSVISGCSVVGNAEEGIFTYYGTIVTGCNADSNGTGIYVSYNCQVLNNNCSKNGASAAAKGSGIYVGGEPNRIEGNNVTDNYYGIQVTTINGANNLIIRNSASGNTTNYVFSGAMAGTVVTSATINSSSNPNANFSY
jgi:parallel beta-helix repeat protein